MVHEVADVVRRLGGLGVEHVESVVDQPLVQIVPLARLIWVGWGGVGLGGRGGMEWVGTIG